MNKLDIVSPANAIQEEINNRLTAIDLAEQSLKEKAGELKQKSRKLTEREKACGEREVKIQRDFEELNRKQNAFIIEEKAAKDEALVAERIRKARAIEKKANELMEEAKLREAETLKRAQEHSEKAKDYKKKIEKELTEAVMKNILGG